MLCIDATSQNSIKLFYGGQQLRADRLFITRAATFEVPRPGGAIPRQLENLSRLVFLDLSYTDFLEAECLMRLSYDASLKHLDMSGSNLSQAVDWFQAINSIPSQLSLHLSYCQLSLVVPLSTPSHANHTSASLADIDLSINSLPSSKFV
uniref:Uncharacterized protein n=1 Tax=Populus alba TaxID=43335 RepID=A0A4V5ZX98_POPAL|nr:hypothetical protein D5086_0000328300 [Populus alba]